MAAIDTGIIGWPVAQSLSPVIHTYWRERYGIEGKYEPFPIDPAALEPGVKKLKAQGLRGFNVTVPHKETIGAYLDTVDATAHRIGAVNTVVRDGQTWRGTNTDAYGFITHLKEALLDFSPYKGRAGRGTEGTFGPATRPSSPHPRIKSGAGANPSLAGEGILDKTVILGAGGAARAVIAALQDAGAGSILLLNRTKSTADALAAEFGVKAGDWEARDELLTGTSLLVNTTVLGMTGKPPLVISLAALPNHAAVYDIVYAPLMTPLLAAAAARGLHAIDGLGMLLYQAQLAFKEWHGVLPEVDAALREIVLAEIQKRNAA